MEKLMILSKNREQDEYSLIRRPEHIARVWERIGGALPKYWSSFIHRQAAKRPAARLAGHFGSGSSAVASPAVLAETFASAVQAYEKAAAKYRDFFDPEAMEEFGDDPNTFKQHLAKDVPVIAGTLNQRRPELQEWQRDFRGAKGRDLLEVFSNVLEFREEWSIRHPQLAYAIHDDPEAFELNPLDDDETMMLTNVIGMGIKSIILYHLDPSRFPQRARSDLYGLYFLAGMEAFGLPSGSSEFLMINDREPASNGSLIMEHNFWYPYGLFSLYASRIYRWMNERMQSVGCGLDPHVRYVFVAHFLNEVCSEHVEHMKVMRAHDRFEVPA
jgi:hypothetical protein